MNDDDLMVRLWLETFEPAVDIEISGQEVVLRSTRHRLADPVVRRPRTANLQSDLTTALGQLVSQMS